MRCLLVSLFLGLLAGCVTGSATLGELSGVEQFEGQPATGEGEMETPATPDETHILFRANFEDYGPAPELTNEIWLNTDQPLRLAELRGKVVLLEMWTFG